jgi:RNA polymerase sigma-70 factor (ECF subfamily)
VWVDQAWNEHHEAIHRFLIVNIGANDAEDALVDVFVVALRKLDFEPDNHKAWLFEVARKVSLQYVRKRNLHIVMDIFTVFSEKAEPIDLVNSHSEMDLIERVLRDLSRADREVLSLAMSQSFTLSEMAKHLGVSNQACSTRLHRARERFAKKYAQAIMLSEEPR